MLGVAVVPVRALAAPRSVPVAPQPGGHYSNGRTLEFGHRAAAISGGVLTYSGRGNRVPGLPRPSLPIRGSFATTTTFKWKVTIKVGRCRETRSSTLTLGR